MPVKSILAAFFALMLAATAAVAERAKSRSDKPAARDSAKIQDCIKSATGGPLEQERCIGIVADACV